MKAFFVTTILVSVLFAAGARAQTAPSQANSGSLAQSLIAKSNSLHSLTKSKSVGALRSLLTDDFQNVSSDGKLHGRGELLGNAEDGALHDFQFYDPRVIQIDDNTTLVTYNLIVSMPEGDDLLAPRYQKISDLWVRQGSEWRLKFEQATPLRPID
jgi:hypothetical protein